MKDNYIRAQVISNIDPQNLGRVLVNIPELMDTNQQAIWAYPANTPYGGSNTYMSGNAFYAGEADIPEIGQWVWVFFEKNNPNLVYYVGGVSIANKPLSEATTQLGPSAHTKTIPSGKSIILSDSPQYSAVTITGSKNDQTAITIVPGNQDALFLTDKDLLILQGKQSNYCRVHDSQGTVYNFGQNSATLNTKSSMVTMNNGSLTATNSGVVHSMTGSNSLLTTTGCAGGSITQSTGQTMTKLGPSGFTASAPTISMNSQAMSSINGSIVSHNGMVSNPLSGLNFSSVTVKSATVSMQNLVSQNICGIASSPQAMSLSSSQYPQLLEQLNNTNSTIYNDYLYPISDLSNPDSIPNQYYVLQQNYLNSISSLSQVTPISYQINNCLNQNVPILSNLIISKLANQNGIWIPSTSSTNSTSDISNTGNLNNWIYVNVNPNTIISSTQPSILTQPGSSTGGSTGSSTGGSAGSSSTQSGNPTNYWVNPTTGVVSVYNGSNWIQTDPSNITNSPSQTANQLANLINQYLEQQLPTIISNITVAIGGCPCKYENIYNAVNNILNQVLTNIINNNIGEISAILSSNLAPAVSNFVNGIVTNVLNQYNLLPNVYNTINTIATTDITNDIIALIKNMMIDPTVGLAQYLTIQNNILASQNQTLLAGSSSSPSSQLVQQSQVPGIVNSMITSFMNSSPSYINSYIALPPSNANTDPDAIQAVYNMIQNSVNNNACNSSVNPIIQLQNNMINYLSNQGNPNVLQSALATSVTSGIVTPNQLVIISNNISSNTTPSYTMLNSIINNVLTNPCVFINNPSSPSFSMNILTTPLGNLFNSINSFVSNSIVNPLLSELSLADLYGLNFLNRFNTSQCSTGNNPFSSALINSATNTLQTALKNVIGTPMNSLVSSLGSSLSEISSIPNILQQSISNLLGGKNIVSNLNGIFSGSSLFGNSITSSGTQSSGSSWLDQQLQQSQLSLSLINPPIGVSNPITSTSSIMSNLSNSGITDTLFSQSNPTTSPAWSSSSLTGPSNTSNNSISNSNSNIALGMDSSGNLNMNGIPPTQSLIGPDGNLNVYNMMGTDSSSMNPLSGYVGNNMNGMISASLGNSGSPFSSMFSNNQNSNGSQNSSSSGSGSSGCSLTSMSGSILSSVGSSIGSAFNSIAGGLQNGLKSLTGSLTNGLGLGNITNSISNGLTSISSTLNQTISSVSSALGSPLSITSNISNAISNSINSIIGSGSSAFSSLSNSSPLSSWSDSGITGSLLSPDNSTPSSGWDISSGSWSDSGLTASMLGNTTPIQNISYGGTSSSSSSTNSSAAITNFNDLSTQSQGTLGYTIGSDGSINIASKSDQSINNVSSITNTANQLSQNLGVPVNVNIPGTNNSGISLGKILAYTVPQIGVGTSSSINMLGTISSSINNLINSNINSLTGNIGGDISNLGSKAFSSLSNQFTSGVNNLLSGSLNKITNGISSVFSGLSNNLSSLGLGNLSSTLGSGLSNALSGINSSFESSITNPLSNLTTSTIGFASNLVPSGGGSMSIPFVGNVF